ncbi:MAG: tellurium resistance protein, partial [Anaerolineales bacterium]
KPLRANNAESLVNYIKWASTAVLKSASAPASQQVGATAPATNVPIPDTPGTGPATATDVW